MFNELTENSLSHHQKNGWHIMNEFHRKCHLFSFEWRSVLTTSFLKKLVTHRSNFCCDLVHSFEFFLLDSWKMEAISNPTNVDSSRRKRNYVINKYFFNNWQEFIIGIIINFDEIIKRLQRLMKYCILLMGIGREYRKVNSSVDLTLCGNRTSSVASRRLNVKLRTESHTDYCI